MTVYTGQTLKEMNLSYDFEHGLTTTDVEKVNGWVKLIEEGRKSEKPQVGDIVEFTDKYGDYYKNAHIEGVYEDVVNICNRPSIPFVSKSREGLLSTSTGGGSWGNIPSNLKFIGKRKKVFTTWGHWGPIGNGAVNFLAEVNVWEYQEKDLQYTTKTHDRFDVKVNEDVKSHEYKYVVYKNNSNYTAMKTDEEYKAWLDTFEGVEFDGGWFYSKTVWTLKQESLCVPLSEYLTVDGVIDTTLCNGTIQECKRIINGTVITTYLPYQNDKIEKEGVRYMNAYKKNM
ncbi:DUF4121 family protein [Priestia filamentosa]|uniref:DUF4121 family protein n=1 Tax=Priestia filamentosa TaxID=1402861 RepID=UPI003981FA6C